MEKDLNLKFINDAIIFTCQKLNELKINYYIVGAIGAYIDANIPLERIHEDLDILIEEKSVNKLSKVFENTDYIFYDNRLKNNKVLNHYGYPDGEHEVIANYKYNNFHIGFFLFRKNRQDYTIIDYFKENNEIKKLERTLPIKYFYFQYNNEPKNYCGINLKSVRKELIYKNKKIMNRKKDLFDIQKLENHINEDILNNLSGLSKHRKIKTISVN
ncbi:MAG: hypothetical protein IJO33_01395 [Bacilli bacterium]|nr:hypothetical protein [Bacilli bacterium]MBQ9833829.1 hypothetical protein [Bacilli bacterium]